MKRKIVATLMCVAIVMSMVSCGSEDATAVMGTDVVESEAVAQEEADNTEQSEAASVEETATEAHEQEETIATEIEEETTEVVEEETVATEEETVVEEDYTAFDPSNITVNEDGTCTYSEEFINAVLNMPQFANFTVDEIKIFLDGISSMLTEATDSETVYILLDIHNESDAYNIISEGSEKAVADDFNIIAMNATKYAKSAVNVRSGPSTDFDKIGGLSTNQQVTITGQCESTGWYEIEFNGGKGYVSNNYLSDSKVEIPTTSNSTPSADAGQNGNLGGADGLGNVIAPPWDTSDPGGIVPNATGGVSTTH